MELWLLSRPEEKVTYDQYGGFIIRAETEAEARKIAFDAHDRAGYFFKTWVDADATCTIVTPEGDPGIILSDFNAG